MLFVTLCFFFLVMFSPSLSWSDTVRVRFRLGSELQIGVSALTSRKHFVDLVRIVMGRWIAQYAITVKFAFHPFPRFDCWNNSPLGL
jgi:hypothetical protein